MMNLPHVEYHTSRVVAQNIKVKENPHVTIQNIGIRENPHLMAQNVGIQENPPADRTTQTNNLLRDLIVGMQHQREMITEQ